MTANHVEINNAMIAGGIAGSIGKTLTAPLSRLTILYQVSPIKSVGNVHNNFQGSLYNSFYKVFKQEGFISFWKGNLTSVLHRFPYSAINFSCYELSKEFITDNYYNGDKSKETLTTRFVCGAIAGSIACVACYPLDLVRTRLTVIHNKKIAESNVNNPIIQWTKPKIGSAILLSMQNIIEKEGFNGLYRGLVISLAVSVPNLAIGFSAYGSMKETLFNNKYIDSKYFKKGNTDHLNIFGALLCGGISGILSSIITFPADVVRRRLQVVGLTTHMDATQVIKVNAYSEFVKIIEVEGLRGVYRGIVPELLKVTPMVGITFSAYEFLMNILEKE